MEGQSSTPLSDQGFQQANQLSRVFIPDDIDSDINSTVDLPTHLYSSPLLRARQTAQILSQALNQADHTYDYQETDSLQEIHQGIFEGLTWTEATARYPDLCAQLMSQLAWQPVPQAESLIAARHRAQQWVDHILQRHQPGDIIWAVSHAGILQHIIAAILGCDRTWKLSIHHTALFEFWLTQQPAQRASERSNQTTESPITIPPAQTRFNPECWIIRRFNDCSHLK